MKTFIPLLFVISIASNLSAQIPRTQVYKVQAHDWSNETVFFSSPPPIIKGLGIHSDSLSNMFGGIFYQLGDEYYRITTWAEYYSWFIKKFPNFFSDALLYEFYFQTGDNIGMASYIASHRYLGRYYPTQFQISFVGGFLNNRLGSNKDLALSEKQVSKFRRALESGQVSNRYANSRRAEIPSKPVAVSNRSTVQSYDRPKSPARVVSKKVVLDQ